MFFCFTGLLSFVLFFSYFRRSTKAPLFHCFVLSLARVFRVFQSGSGSPRAVLLIPPILTFFLFSCGDDPPNVSFGLVFDSFFGAFYRGSDRKRCHICLLLSLARPRLPTLPVFLSSPSLVSKIRCLWLPSIVGFIFLIYRPFCIPRVEFSLLPPTNALLNCIFLHHATLS